MNGAALNRRTRLAIKEAAQPLSAALASGDMARVGVEADTLVSEHQGRTDPTSLGILVQAAEAMHIVGRWPDAHRLLVDACAQRFCPARGWFAAAALQWDQGDPAASMDSARVGLSRLGPLDERLTIVRTVIEAAWPPSSQAPIKTVEMIVFTHVTPKLVRNAELAAPGLGLLEATLTSLEREMSVPVLPTTIMFDSRGTALDALYESNLMELCAARGARLHVGCSRGLKQQWLAAIEQSAADAIFFVEHDWKFLPGCPSLTSIVDFFNRSPEVNYIRLNKRQNKALAMDWVALPGGVPELDKLTRVPHFANLPHLVRRTALDRLFVPLVTRSRSFDRINDGAGGVEEAVHQTFVKASRLFGLTFTLRLWGTFLYGPLGARRRVTHLGY